MNGNTTRLVPTGIVLGVTALLGIGASLLHRAEAQVNTVALADAPKPVSVLRAEEVPYRPSRVYVGTLEPWVRAAVGPQLVSAFVDTVLVRPGASVKKGEVLATLDCRNASATSRAVAMQARALDARQKAVSHEAARVQGLLDGGFVSQNEAEQKAAQSASEQAQLLATQAKLLGTALEVDDCVLRAPFDGEVAGRSADPGAFARPGTPIVSLVDRSVVRLHGDAPEVDFGVVAPGTEVRIHVLSTGKDLGGKISRRSPAADDATRTVAFEIDLENPDRTIPVGTTAEMHIDVGERVPAIRLPLRAVAVRSGKATAFVVENGVAAAKTAAVLGEADGFVFLEPSIPAGASVVTEGRGLLKNGDQVAAAEEVSAREPLPAGASAERRVP